MKNRKKCAKLLKFLIKNAVLAFFCVFNRKYINCFNVNYTNYLLNKIFCNENTNLKKHVEVFGFLILYVVKC